MDDITKTYLDAGTIFFEPGFANLKRDKGLASMFLSYERAKTEFSNMIQEYVSQNQLLAEVELRNVLMQINYYSVKDITDVLLKNKFKKIGKIFFGNGYAMARKKYGWLSKLGLLPDQQMAIARMEEGIDWYVDNNYEQAKVKFLSLRQLLQVRLDRKRTVGTPPTAKTD